MAQPPLAEEGRRDPGRSAAEVCEQQRVAIEDMARDRRRAERAEADAAAARADVGGCRCESGRRKTSRRRCRPDAPRPSLDLVKDQKAQSIAAIAEVDGMKAARVARQRAHQGRQAPESQAELIKSLKDETARNKEAAAGAVAGRQTRNARRRRAPNPPRMTCVSSRRTSRARTPPSSVWRRLWRR